MPFNMKHVDKKKAGEILIWALFLFPLLYFATGDRASACAPAPPMGSIVEVAEESAIIVWDEQNGMEHFIRRATFRSDAANFGFLVPTPTVPDLKEERDDIFVRLEDLMRPEILKEDIHGVRPVSLFLSFFLLNRVSEEARAPITASVRILAAATVSGYDATVLEADDASALVKWLQEHGYAVSPSLTEWFQPYIDKKWKITAFKISGDGKQPVATTAVRMSFKTDSPFFPYREPASQREQASAQNSPRLLRVFFIGTKRVEGGLGAGHSAWPGKTRWSDHLQKEKWSGVASQFSLPQNQMPADPWLTVFEDDSSPRPGTDDLYFVPSQTQDRIVPRPIIEESDQRIPIPVDLILLLIAILIGIKMIRKRKARALQA